MSVDLQSHDMLALSRASLSALRAALLRDAAEGQAASAFQEAGYAGGDGIFATFRDWLAAGGHPAPDALNAAEFGERSAEFFRDAGWGSLEVGVLGDAVITLDASNWSEADPNLGAAHPSCFYSSGMFSDFFSRLGGQPLGAFEVECRSTGASRCRFLLGSPETLQHVYGKMVEGLAYEDAIRQSS